jgi:hypothetical protein
MRHKSPILVFLMAVGLVLTSFSADSAAYTFSLRATSDIAGNTPKTIFNPNEVFYLHIVLDNANGVAGVAFTLDYPSAILTAPVTNAQGVSSDITSPFPFTFGGTTQTHRENSTTTPGKIYLAGAAIDTSDGGSLYSSGEVILFRIKFTVKSSATPGIAIPILLLQTVLNNPEAGYNDEPVKVLVGAVDNTNANWSNPALAFPNLMPSPPSPLAQKSLYVNDADSIDDAWEMAQFGNLTTANDLTDFDGDGYLDKYEQPTQNNTNPKVQDPADFSDPTYNAATDTRGPYQVVDTHPASPGAGPGESFNTDVYYFTSNGAQNLLGLTLRIHYDSTKLTWNSFSNVLATGLGTPSSSALNDISNFDGDPSTDKYLTVPWSGGNWPGVTCTQASPLKLYTVTFTVKPGLAEGITSHIRFSASSVAAGYTFSSVPALFEVRLFERGDVTLDGNITPADATACFQLYLTKDWDEMTDLEKFTADYNNSGSVTPADATAIFQHYLNQ